MKKEILEKLEYYKKKKETTLKLKNKDYFQFYKGVVFAYEEIMKLSVVKTEEIVVSIANNANTVNTSNSDEVIDTDNKSSNNTEKVLKPESFKTFCSELHTKIQNLLLTLTGKKQKTSKIGIGGKSYSFLMNSSDFYMRMLKVFKNYKIEDWNKAEKVILNYVRRCNSENSWFPILEYYLVKDGSSRFATDYFNFEDLEEKDLPQNKTVNINDLE